MKNIVGWYFIDSFLAKFGFLPCYDFECINGYISQVFLLVLSYELPKMLKLN